jgi:DNA-binding CsgD family transcriptional regulator
MVALDVSGDELQTLLEITSALSTTLDSSGCLDDVTARVGKLVPFARCILMHERGNEGDAATLIYEFVGTPAGGSRPDPTYTRSLSVGRYLEHFQRVETFQNAFFWRAAAANAGGTDPQMVNFIRQARLNHGTAGLVNSAEGSAGKITTLFQLECAPGDLPAKHLFFMNIIVFYLHVHLVHKSTGLFAQNRGYALTCKEKQVLQWIVGGKTSWEVSRILSVSERTIKFHLRNIYTKLNVANRAQAVNMANQLRLV